MYAMFMTINLHYGSPRLAQRQKKKKEQERLDDAASCIQPLKGSMKVEVKQIYQAFTWFEP